jgi:hypothetical protein
MKTTVVNVGNKNMSQLLFNFGFECPIQSVKANKDVLNLRGKYQHLIYIDDVNIGRKHTYFE